MKIDFKDGKRRKIGDKNLENLAALIAKLNQNIQA